MNTIVFHGMAAVSLVPEVTGDSGRDRRCDWRLVRAILRGPVGIEAPDGNRILIAVVRIVSVLGAMDGENSGAICGGAIFQGLFPHACRDRGNGRNSIAKIAGKIPHEVSTEREAAGVYSGRVCRIISDQ